VWQAIERTTGHKPAYLSRDWIGADCPVGCGGTVAVQFLDNPPRIRIAATTDYDRPDQCSRGCPGDRIFKALT
jgi:hypothetical protein